MAPRFFRLGGGLAIALSVAVGGCSAVLDFDSREVSVARAILKNARTKILVADQSKFQRTAPVRICTIDEVDVFVTDLEPPAPFAKACASGETRITLAEAEAPSPATIDLVDG